MTRPYEIDIIDGVEPDGEFLFFTHVCFGISTKFLRGGKYLMKRGNNYFKVSGSTMELMDMFHDEWSKYLRECRVPYHLFRVDYVKSYEKENSFFSEEIDYVKAINEKEREELQKKHEEHLRTVTEVELRIRDQQKRKRSEEESEAKNKED